MIKQKNENGITLVALIITIIVLIILAAVSINAILSSNFINLATQGTINYAEAQVDEEKKLDNVAKLLGDTINSIASMEGKSPVDPSKPGENPSLPSNWEENKVYAVESEDGITIPVPKEFTVSNVDGEKRVEDGFVIKYGENEFVWVPVEDTSEMFGTDKDGNSLGKLYEFVGAYGKVNDPPKPLNWTEDENKIMNLTYEGWHQEPGVLSNYDNTATEIIGVTSADEFKKQLQKEFEEMRKSVETYGGFYIGRYETGNLSGERVVVQKGNTDIDNQNWYMMYQKSKTLAEGTNVNSSMIWGCQWDHVLQWFLKSDDERIVKYVTNSTGMGNYYIRGSNKVLPAGSNPDYSVKNIYDLAGNVCDATLELDASVGGRSSRGGHVGSYGDTSPASYRSVWGSTVATPRVGFKDNINHIIISNESALIPL